MSHRVIKCEDRSVERFEKKLVLATALAVGLLFAPGPATGDEAHFFGVGYVPLALTKLDAHMARRILPVLPLPVAGTMLASSHASASLNDDVRKFMKEMGLYSLSHTCPPAFNLPDLQGKKVSLRSVRGKIVLLNFWATWCPPCRAEMPSMQRLYEKLQAHGLEILAISIDAQGERVVEPFMREFSLTFPALLDTNGDVASEYKVRGIPTSFIIDDQGRMVAGVVGPREWDSPSAVALFDALLKKRKKPLPLVSQESLPPKQTSTC